MIIYGCQPLTEYILFRCRPEHLRIAMVMNNGLPHNYINQILLMEDGSGYIATESDRLYRIDPDSGIFTSDASNVRDTSE